MASCTKPARGSAVGASPPVSAEENNPCNKTTVATVNGVDFSAHNLCWPHLVMKLGFASIPNGPIVYTA